MSNVVLFRPRPEAVHRNRKNIMVHDELRCPDCNGSGRVPHCDHCPVMLACPKCRGTGFAPEQPIADRGTRAGQGDGAAVERSVLQQLAPLSGGAVELPDRVERLIRKGHLGKLYAGGLMVLTLGRFICGDVDALFKLCRAIERIESEAPAESAELSDRP